MEQNNKLTTVKILNEIYSKFKQTAFDTNTTLQRVVNRSLYKYVNDETFRESIDNERSLIVSGSQY
jgi:predicted transcriptional regulator